MNNGIILLVNVIFVNGIGYSVDLKCYSVFIIPFEFTLGEWWGLVFLEWLTNPLNVYNGWLETNMVFTNKEPT